MDSALKTSTFKNYCNCGGYAWSMNGRPQEQPHMIWCAQYEEYAQWWAATHKDKEHDSTRTIHSGVAYVADTLSLSH